MSDEARNPDDTTTIIVRDMNGNTLGRLDVDSPWNHLWSVKAKIGTTAVVVTLDAEAPGEALD